MGMMERDPQRRMTAKEALSHKWILRKVHNDFDIDVAKQTISNLQDFRAETKLKQAAITFMVTHLSTKQEQKELKKSFNQFDQNGDGKIELDEFIEAYKKVYPNFSKGKIVKEATEFFQAVDVDKNGVIDYGEWCAATINKRTIVNESNLKQAFQLFDKDGGGTISAQEVAQILGHSMSQDQSVWKDIIKEVDLNGDGQIDYNEFKQMVGVFTSKKQLQPT